jgi:bifunctional DNA-binding transcriptional regulator/antitoxin component of YhaV-PrlF toxin-antitoxin module
MKAYELTTKVTSGGEIRLPEQVRQELPAESVVRVIVLIDEPQDPAGGGPWNRLTAEQFLAGYDDADRVYDSV